MLFRSMPAAGVPVADAAPRFGLRGPSTTTNPYLVPNPALGDMVGFTSVLTTGDTVGGYKMAGIPDGLGAWATSGSQMRLVMNHELRRNEGAARGHGSKGSFVSNWTINRDTLRVEAGADLVQSPNAMYTWDRANRAYSAGTVALERLCSADLAAPSAYWWNGLGTTDRIFLNGEETTGGRALAWIASGPNAGQVWELPRMGAAAWENLLANPLGQTKTIVIGDDDGSLETAPVAANNPSQLSVYVGDKQATGTPIERAGLTNGKLYGIKVPSVLVETNATSLATAGAAFSLQEMGPNGDVSKMTGAQLQAESDAEEIGRAHV